MHHAINRSVEFSSSKFFASAQSDFDAAQSSDSPQSSDAAQANQKALPHAKAQRASHPSLSTTFGGSNAWHPDEDVLDVATQLNALLATSTDSGCPGSESPTAESSNTESATAESSNTEDSKTSLKTLLPKARFFSGSDIVYSSIAESVDECVAGQLVVYRIGIDCPEDLISKALALGAAGILTEQILPVPLPQCIVGDTDRTLAEIAAQQLSDETGARPDQRLITVGIVGDRAKTTTALCLATVLRDAPCRVAYETDLGHSDGIGSETLSQACPSGAELMQRLTDAADAGASVSVIELSDQALRSGGYDAIQFDILVVVGRNDRRDDFGPSALECAIERVSKSGVLVIASSDKTAIQAAQDSAFNVVTYDVDSPADLTLKSISNEDGLLTAMISHEMNSAMMESTLGYGFCTASLAAAAAVGVITQNPLVQIAESLSQLRELPGRCQRVASNDWETAQTQPEMFLDVAGTPERMEFILSSIQEQQNSRPVAATSTVPFANAKPGFISNSVTKSAAKLWCVLAVDQNDSNETLMQYGRLLETMPDHCVLTCHPSAKERFLAISHGVLDGVQDCAAMRLVADQERAIAWAIQGARAQDTVVVIGGVDRTSPQSQRSDLERLKAAMTSEPAKTKSQAAVPSLKLFQPEE